MTRRFFLSLLTALLAAVTFAAPAAAQECIEVGQVKHCLPA